MLAPLVTLILLPVCLCRSLLGYPHYPGFTGSGQGTAIGTAGAELGNAFSTGNTFTDLYGGSRSSALGTASGVHPSSTSVANSASQGSPYPSGIPDYRKRREVQNSGDDGMSIYEEEPSYDVQAMPNMFVPLNDGSSNTGGNSVLVIPTSGQMTPFLQIGYPSSSAGGFRNIGAAGVATSNFQPNVNAGPASDGTIGFRKVGAVGVATSNSQPNINAGPASDGTLGGGSSGFVAGGSS